MLSTLKNITTAAYEAPVKIELLKDALVYWSTRLIVLFQSIVQDNKRKRNNLHCTTTGALLLLFLCEPSTLLIMSSMYCALRGTPLSGQPVTW